MWLSNTNFLIFNNVVSIAFDVALYKINCLSGSINFSSVRHDCKKLLKVEKIVDRYYGEILDFGIFDVHFVHRIEYSKWCVIVIFFNCVCAEFHKL